MKSTETIKNKATEAVGNIARVSVWNDRRVYINLDITDRRNAGERNHQLYIDIKTGKLVNQMGKGCTRRDFDAAVAAAVETLQAAGF